MLKHPRPYKICQHGAGQKECGRGRGGQGREGEARVREGEAETEEERPCNTVEDLKYRLVRFLIDSADVQGGDSVETFLALVSA